jgi:hypothetical protein
LLPIALLLSFLATAEPPAAADPSAPLSGAELREVVITLYRGMCYGECPVYSVRITGDGWVSYSGGDFVKVEGNRRLRIRRADVRKLVGVFEKAGYFDIQRHYTEEACGADETCGYTTDSPSVSTSITIRGKTYQVDHSYGCKCAPEGLYDIYAAIDKAGRTKRWVGK